MNKKLRTLKDLKLYDKFEATNQFGLPTYFSSIELIELVREHIRYYKKRIKIKEEEMHKGIGTDDINNEYAIIEWYAQISILEHIFNIET